MPRIFGKKQSTTPKMDDKSKKSSKKSSTKESMGAAPSDPRMLDVAAMNFEKRVYQKDDQYQEIKTGMVSYNNSISAPNTRENGQNTLNILKNLLNKCVGYLSDHATGDKEEHKGRCKNVENLIYQISMRGNVLAKANANINTLKEDNKDTSKESTEIVLEGLQEAVNAKGNGKGRHKHSKLIGMIAANVMADQAKTKLSFEGGSSGTNKHYPIPGETKDYQYNVKVNDKYDNENNINDNISSALHEFTHVSVSKTFGGNDQMIALKRNDDGTLDPNSLSKEVDLRKKEAANLIQIGTDTENKGANYVTKLRDYGLSGTQMDKYKNNEKMNEMKNIFYALKDLDKNSKSKLLANTQQNETGNLHWTDLYKDEHKLENQEITIFGSNKTTKADVWVPKDKDNESLKLTDYETKHTDGTRGNNALITIDKLHDESKETLYNDFSQQLENANIDENVKDKLKKDAVQFNSYNAQIGDNYNAMIEYDSTLNQALLLYERQYPKDRSSKYYRNLKAAALRAHVRRLQQRLENEEAAEAEFNEEAEAMANDMRQSLRPTTLNPLVDRAYHIRQAKQQSQTWMTNY